MNNPFAFFKKKDDSDASPPAARPHPAAGIRPEHALVWSIAGLALLLALVLGWDAYLFRQSLYPETTSREIKNSALQKTLPADLDDAIKMLDERERAFQRILDSAATGTPSQ